MTGFFIDPAATLMEEGLDNGGIWPCTGRRRHHNDEWDDYIELYDMRLDILSGDHVESQQRWRADITVTPPATVVGAKTTDTIEDRTCTVCGEVKDTKRGRRVHESRTHGIKSERADYYAEWRQ